MASSQRSQPPGSPSGVLSTRWAVPPGYLVVDTSAFVAALVPDVPTHADYAGFLERCALAGTVLAYCELVELELAHAAIGIQLTRRHGKRANMARRDGRALRPARAFAVELREAFSELLTGFDVIRIPISQNVHAMSPDGYPVSTSLTQAAVTLVERVGVGSYDAVHIVCAMVASAPLLARDVGFARASAITLITDPTRIASARRLRANNRLPYPETS